MGTVAKLTASVEANTDGFSRGMNRARQDLKNLILDVSPANGALGSFQDALTKVDLSGRNIKKSLGEVGHAFHGIGDGASGVVLTMLKMGPAVGLAVGALHLYNKVTEQQAEIHKHVEESATRYFEILHHIGEITGAIKPVEFFSVDIDAQIQALNKELEENAKLQKKASDSWFSGGSAIRELDREANKYRDTQRELLKLQQQTDAISGDREKYKEGDFDLKMSTKSGSFDRIVGDIDLQSKYVDKLAARLNQLPEGGKAYLQVLHEWQDMSLKLQDSQQALFDKNDKLHKEAAKKETEFQNHLREEAEKTEKLATKFFEEQLKRSRQFAEDNKNPLEKFADKVNDIIDLFDQGGTSIENMNRGINKAIETLIKDEDKGFEKKEVKAGSLTQVDLANINPLFMGGKKDKVEVEGQSEMIELTKQIKALLAIPQPARTSA